MPLQVLRVYSFTDSQLQITIVIQALRDKVVELVQDLNGNHVVQKCLNRLTAPDAQVNAKITANFFSIDDC
jgi:hypothetical protein